MNDKLKFYRSTLVQMTKGLIGYTPMHKLSEDAGKITKAIMKQVDEFEVAMEQHFNLDKERVNYYFGGDNCVAKDFTCTDPNFFKVKTEPMRTIVDNGPQYPSDNNEELDYVCKLTQWDIDDLKQRLNLAIKAFDKYKTDGEEFKQSAEDVLKMYINDVIEFLDNKDNIRTKCQNDQIARKIEKANQKLYGTLGEHWKELMTLFEVKNYYGMHYIKMFVNDKFSTVKDAYIILTRIENSLGIDFIKDFIKACEKCED